MNSQTLSQLLGERWFRIPDRAWNHPTVQTYRESRVRFQTVHAGRRSFKTELAKRRLVSEAMQNPKKRYFLGGPTRDQAKRIFWNDIKALIPRFAIGKLSESELWIQLLNGSELWVIGFDKPERFEGSPWHGGVITEMANLKETAWNENIMPALRDTYGWAILEGVPEGRNHYFDLCKYAQEGTDPEWADYGWFTADVRDAAEIAKERQRLDERTFRQEYEGSFESYEGRAYVYYDPDRHRHSTAYNGSLPVCVACDFNLDPCLWIIGQDQAGFISLQDELKQRNTDIWRMCSELKTRLEARIGDNCRRHRVIFYGDYEHGKTRSVSATATSWQIMRDEFNGWNVEFRLRSHPRIVDRVNAVNSKLRSADGTVQFELDPACVETHKDLEQVSMEMLTKERETGDRTHASDAMGYWIAYEYPVIRQKAVQY